MAISNYIIITADIDDLAQQCAKLCGEGWTPVGGVAFNANKDLYHQALVQYDNKPAAKIEKEEKYEEVMTVGPFVVGSEWKPAEWEEEFWTVVVKECSKEALFFVSVNSIRSIKKLLSEMSRPSFAKEAGEKIFMEFKKIIEKHNWKTRTKLYKRDNIFF